MSESEAKSPESPPVDPLSLPCYACGAPPGQSCKCGPEKERDASSPILDFLQGVADRGKRAEDRASWEAFACAWIASRSNVHSTEQIHVIRAAIQLADAMLAESRRRFEP